ncbi:MAG: UDP-N-acetylglucosamine pyrophosphorylase, partial [Clostridia bacterium]|nr:UDP-N-acetylglucosamine pyrophosphorylase [Clostridia bacterium]
MFEYLQIENLLNLDCTIAYDLFGNYTYPWEVLPHIGEFILETGQKLCMDDYTCKDGNIWIHKEVKIASTASITGPAIICRGAEIRHCAFIRGNAIVGEGAVVGNSCELKNCILFDRAQVPHYNYVGDSILGTGAHLGAGAVTSNLKIDKTNVTVKTPDAVFVTGLKKFGAV